MPLKKWLLVISWIVLSLGFTSTAFSQTEARQAILLDIPLDDPLSFYAINAAGESTLLGSLPADIRISDYQYSLPEDWSIPLADGIILSPDQQYVAFSVIKVAEKKIFVFRVTGEEVWSASVEHLMQIRWSPQSDGFIFVPETIYDASDELEVLYFDLASQQISLIANLSDHPYAQQFQWVNDDTLIFTSLMNSEGHVLNTLSRDGAIATILDLNSAPITGALCEREWSESRQLLYIGVGCTTSPESIIIESVYAVDLVGQNSVVLPPPLQFQADDLYTAYFSIIGIEIHDDVVYVVTYESIFEQDNDFSTWRILRLADGDTTEVYNVVVDGHILIQSPSLSPTGKYLTVGTYEGSGEDAESWLLVIDVETGEFVRRIPTQSFGWAITWLNNHTFLYANSYDSVTCRCPYPRPASAIMRIDLSQFAVDELTSQFLGSTWLFDND